MRESVTAVLGRCAAAIRSSPADRLLDATGLKPFVRRGYWWAVIRLSGPQLVTVGDVTAAFDVNSVTEYWRTQTLFEERPVIKDVLDELELDDVFYDVGANIGIYSCLAARVVTEGHVVSFEPHPETRARLRANLAQNGDRFTISPYALSDTEGTATIGMPAENDRPGTYSLLDGTADSAVKVGVIRGDTLVRDEKLPAPDVIKIDVEGAELSVLDGLESTLGRGGCRVVYVEIHGAETRTDDTTNPVESSLEDAGFDVSVLHARDGEHFVKGLR